MIGEVSIGGVYLPALLVLAIIALGATFALIRLLGILGLYRLIAARPLIDLSIFILVLWAASVLSSSWTHLP